MSTMQELYLAVRDARPGSYENQWEDVAAKIGMDPNGSEFDQLVKAMKVSGYIRQKHDELTIGPVALPDASGAGVIAARRPRPDATAPNKDRLRLARRAHLWDDETLAGSDYVKDGDDRYACVAGVTKDGQPSVRVGLPGYDKNGWDVGEKTGETVQLDDAGVAALERGVDKVVQEGEASAAPYRAAERRLDLAGDRLKHAEGPRVGAQAAEDAFYAELNRESDQALRDRWTAEAGLELYANALDESEREEHDNQQAHYEGFQDQTGSEGHVRASGDERREARARQMLIFYPKLTLAEAREFLLIHEMDYTQRSEAHEARDRELLAKMGLTSIYRSDEVTWLSGMMSVYGKDRAIDDKQALIERVKASARPVTAEQQAEIDAAWREIREAQAEYDKHAGNTICTVVVPGQWGDIVMEATQGEEGDAHQYRVDLRPPGSPKSWSPGHYGDAWQPKPAELRRLAAAVRQQYDQSKPEGWRPPPSGVPQV
jgi:hypothetical protein